MADKITYNGGKKFDLQLSEGLKRERALGAIFEGAKLEKIELKSETWQWEQTGRICIEYRWNDQPSGIAVTEADMWVHELRRDGETLCWLMFPIDRLKKLARDAYLADQVASSAGDGELSDVVLINLCDILK